MNFDNILSNKDDLWNDKKEESIDSLNSRITLVKKYIKNRPEKNIAFVNHAGFIGQMKDRHIKYLDNGEEELKHCFPYKMLI